MTLHNLDAAIHYSAASGPAVNTMSFIWDDTGLIPDLQGAVDGIFGWWGASVMPVVHSQFTLDRVEVSGAQPTVSTQAPIAGGGSGSSAAAAGLTYLIDKIPISGRKGRVFLPGLTETGVDGLGNIKASTRAVVDAAMLAFFTNMELNGTPCALKRANGSTTLLTGFKTRTICGVQTRRFRRSL